jgi:hypothetical protein
MPHGPEQVLTDDRARFDRQLKIRAWSELKIDPHSQSTVTNVCKTRRFHAAIAFEQLKKRFQPDWHAECD